jgi:hypothetical protein
MSIEKSLVSSGKSLYQEDFYGWLQETANLLKEHRFEKLDLENLIEEIETMGRSEKRELESPLTVIAEHLLKLTYWLTEKETNVQGWRSTVVEQRRQVQRLLRESPSLRRLIPEIWIDCYQAAREDTVRKYPLWLLIYSRLNHPSPLKKSLIMTIFLKTEVWYFVYEYNA